MFLLCYQPPRSTQPGHPFVSRMSTSVSWEGNHMSGVALAMRNTESVVDIHLRTKRPTAGRWVLRICSFGLWHTLPLSLHKLCGRPPQYARPCKLTFDLLTLKLVSESRVMWATSANFSLPRPLCSRLRPDVRDRQTSDVRRASSLNAPYPRAGA